MRRPLEYGEERSGKGALLRAAAALAGCTAGFRDPAAGKVFRFDPEGQPQPANEDDRWHRTPVPGVPGALVWLEQPLGDGTLDALILERCALGISALITHVPGRSAEEAVRTVIDAEAGRRDRADAARALGLTGPLTAVVSDSSTRVDAVSGARWTIASGAQMISIHPGAAVSSPSTLRTGTATAADPAELPEAADNARLAYRAAGPSGGPGPWRVAYEELGAWAEVIRQFPPSRAAEVEDVRRIAALSAAHPWIAETLQAMTGRSSLRRAAEVLHVHHSTLQERTRWLAGALGFDIASPQGKSRAALALLLWRISHPV